MSQRSRESNLTNPTMRILWQSSTPVQEYPAYVDAITSHARSVLGDRAALTVRGVEYGTRLRFYKSFDFLNNAQLFDSVVRAEREGYDAVALGCFLDPLLDELREIVDIPVLGLAETAMLIACMHGRRFGILSHNRHLNDKFYAELVRRYGLGERAGPLIHFDLPFDEMARGLSADADLCMARVREAARRAIAGGADCLLLGCGLLNMIVVRSGVTEVDGAPIIDGSGVLMKLAQAMVELRRISGLRVSRVGYFERPNAGDIDDVLKLYRRGWHAAGSR